MTQGNQRVVASAAVGVTVRNVTGSVAVTSPATGGIVRGSVALTATATSNAGVTAVRFEMTAPNGTVTSCAATGTGPSRAAGTRPRSPARQLRRSPR